MWRDSDADQQQVSHDRQPTLLHLLRRGLPAARRLRRILAHIRRATFLLGVLRRRRRGGALPQAPRWGERKYRAPCRRDPPLSQFRKLLASGARVRCRPHTFAPDLSAGRRSHIRKSLTARPGGPAGVADKFKPNRIANAAAASAVARLGGGRPDGRYSSSPFW